MLPERPNRSNRATAVLTQLVPATGGPDSQLCSRNVPGLAGETSAGNILMRSGFHTSRKPSEPSHYKPTGSKTPTHNADAGVNARTTYRVNSTRQYSPTVLNPTCKSNSM